MNGRIYDPLLGRFLSADLVVQDPGDLQSYNRYSYVENRPLTLVDPSGFQSAPPARTALPTPAATQATTVRLIERDFGRLAEARRTGDVAAYDRIQQRIDSRMRQIGWSPRGEGRGPGPQSQPEWRDPSITPAQRNAAARQAERQADVASQGSSLSELTRGRVQTAQPREGNPAEVTGETLLRGVKEPSGNQASVQGNAQRTSPGHAETSQQIAGEMSSNGQYIRIHLNQSLSTITQGEVRDARRPDVAGVTPTGAVTVVEIPSPSQTTASQQAKVDSMVISLGPLAGSSSRVEPIRPPPPPPPEETPLVVFRKP